MKLKVYIKYSSPTYRIANFAQGDWIDLRSTIGYVGEPNDLTYIPLGVAMELPKGFEAVMNPRSSTANKFGFIMANSQGVIDNSYCGDNDEWKCPALFFKGGTIRVGDRICQFRIQLSQKATVWDKLRWLFSNGFEFIEVDYLKGKNRGGFGSTGVAEYAVK